eukprot:GFUD01036108.1.p1 GENE.GFUD01036108.1~~GFUD01036108.1.p1  ORF type:complete len:866 (+),score=215.26 GFUD01036108.1:359-2956(+)
MAAPEEAKEEPPNSDKKPKTKREAMNSDATEENVGTKYNKSVLTTSKSVPTFDGISKTDLEESDYVSESDLPKVTINETSLLFSQSYQPSGGQQKQNGQPLSPGHHKVQFVEMENRRKYSDTQSLVEEEEINCRNVKFCPNKNEKSRSANLCGKSPSKKKRHSRKISETSSGSLTSFNSSNSSNTNFSVVAPDGGFGWVVVAASFFVNMIADGVTFSFGIMFEQFQDEFGSSSAATAGVVSMFHAVPLMTGPIATWLTDRYGCKAVTIVGAILAAIGFLAAAFSHHIALLYLFFGVVAGFGLSLCYVASIIIVAYYFDRRRSFATGISVCGSGVGTFLFAPFTQWLMDSYGGWRGACIILAGIFLNMVVCGMMFKELDWNKRKKIARATSARSITSQMPEIEELRLALQSGDVSLLLQEDEMEQNIASSLITIPTYIKDASKLPEDVLSMIVQNKKTYNYIVDNFPESLIAKSINDLELEEKKEKVCLDVKPEENNECSKHGSESAGVKLKRRMSSLLKGQTSILKKKEVSDLRKYSVPTEAAKPLLEEMPVPTSTVPKHNQSLPPDRVQCLHNLKIRRQSMTYRRACLSTPRYHMKASSCPDIYTNTIIDDTTEDLSRSMKKCCSLKYVTLPFLVFCFSNFILYFWYDVPYVYTIEYAENILKVPNSDSAQILSMIGVLNTIGEVLVGWLSDQAWVSSLTLYAICMCVCGIVTALIPFVHSYSMVLVLSAFYGFCISANYSLTSPILVDLVSIEQFSSAYGFLLACQGVGNLVGPPFAGWLYDYSKEWFLTFDLAGVFIAISGVLLVIIPSITVLKRYLEKVNLGKRVQTCTTNKASDKSKVFQATLANEDITCENGCDHPAEV